MPHCHYSHCLRITVDAWRRFSVLRLRQKNGAKRMLANRALLSEVKSYTKTPR